MITTAADIFDGPEYKFTDLTVLLLNYLLLAVSVGKAANDRKSVKCSSRIDLNTDARFTGTLQIKDDGILPC